MLLPLLPFALLSLLPSVLASQGDRSPAYQRCYDSRLPHCTPSFLFPCSASTSYSCLTDLTNLALSPSSSSSLLLPGGELEGLVLGAQVQFYGKWPFRRFWGTQEILSVVFSLANLWAHYTGLKSLERVRTGSEGGRRLKRWYALNAFVGINTWIWSVVFHTRDNDWTEKADYFSAGASTLYGLWLVLARAGGLYRGRVRARRAMMGVGLAVLIAHCTYLSTGRFDYSYNMTFNLVVGVSQVLLWTLWSLSRSFAPHPSSAADRTPNPIYPLFLLLVFSALELLDLPPVPAGLRLLDAHALWHASTVGVVWMWYAFLKGDLRDVEEQERRMGGLRGRH